MHVNILGRYRVDKRILPLKGKSTRSVDTNTPRPHKVAQDEFTTHFEGEKQYCECARTTIYRVDQDELPTTWPASLHLPQSLAQYPSMLTN